MILKKRLCFVLALGLLSTAMATAKPKDAPLLNKPLDPTVFEQSDSISFDTTVLYKTYKDVTKEDRIMEALEMMKGCLGDYSHNAIMGTNLTNKKMRIEFKNLNEIKPQYASFDALGWKKAGRLYIYINEKHKDAPAPALAALLSHEALHQDEFDSLAEETYAWTMEAAVWTQLSEKYPAAMEKAHPLVYRENMLKRLFEKGDYTNKYIQKAVYSNPGYKNLPTRSPGFETDDL
ncbi:MAG: hypothetical protein PHV37_09725 [Candidatus Gastranaerophilales bacterium]|nr:hypothetical protein [Candidatus Gastranaerophilales bacterium]